MAWNVGDHGASVTVVVLVGLGWIHARSGELPEREREIMRAGLLDPERVRILWEIRLVLAHNRGYRTGWGDAYYRTYRPDVLSGEWAGDSVAETLGDLYSDFDFDDDDDVNALSDLCDAFLAGYDVGHSAADTTGEIRAGIIREYYTD